MFRWYLYYFMKSLVYIISVAGILVSVWGFKKSRKAGYAILAVYFLLPFVVLLIRPFVKPDRALREQRAKVEAPIQETLSESERQQDVEVMHVAKRSVHLRPGQLVLLIAVLLLVLKEQEMKTGEQGAEADGKKRRRLA